jgi:hypothetical protein
MRGTRLYALLTVVMLVALGGASYAVADNGGKKNVKGKLTGYEEVPSISTAGKGTFKAQINRDTNVITFELSYSDISGAASAAHIHFGQRDVNGGVSAFLCGGSTKPACPGTTSATVTGTIGAADVVGPDAQGIAAGELAELVAAIRAGKAYANVHTAKHPGGEIRAQLNNRNRK